MGMAERIDALEKAMAPVELENVRLMMYMHDASKGGDGKPDRLSMILHSGTPSQPARKYHREEAETEEAFLERIERAELAA